MASDSYQLHFAGPGIRSTTITGDGYSGPGDWVTLAANEAVQEHLGLSEEQKAALRQIAEDYRAALRKLYEDFVEREPAGRTRSREAKVEAKKAETNRRIEAVLTGSPMKALKQMSWRVRDGDALLDEEVAAALDLTPAQRQQLLRVREQNEAERREMLEALKNLRFQSQEDLEEFKRKYREKANQRQLDVLTAEQRRKFEALKGQASDPPSLRGVPGL